MQGSLGNGSNKFGMDDDQDSPQQLAQRGMIPLLPDQGQPQIVQQKIIVQKSAGYSDVSGLNNNPYAPTEKPQSETPEKKEDKKGEEQSSFFSFSTKQKTENPPAEPVPTKPVTVQPEPPKTPSYNATPPKPEPPEQRPKEPQKQPVEPEKPSAVQTPVEPEKSKPPAVPMPEPISPQRRTISTENQAPVEGNQSAMNQFPSSIAIVGMDQILAQFNVIKDYQLKMISVLTEIRDAMKDGAKGADVESFPTGSQ
jgi:hypothetical protein